MKKTRTIAGNTRGLAALASMLLAETSQGADFGLPAAYDEHLSLYGITLSGVIDLGVAYQSHGTPLSGSFAPGLEYAISKNSNKAQWTLAPNGMSQSKVRIEGKEPLPGRWTGGWAGSWSAVFKAETSFNPASGRLSDGLRSEVHNNGVALDQQDSGGDSSKAGQIFSGPLYAGISSTRLGSLTFGRQNSLMLDNVETYNPQGISYAFSLIAYSGIAAGVGDTEDSRFDRSLRYGINRHGLRAAAIYQFNGSGQESRNAYQFDLGCSTGGWSVDTIYAHTNGAVSTSSLSAAQTASLPRNSLAGTISDNTGFGGMARYSFGRTKLFAGWERIRFDNPSQPLAAGATTIGGYVLSVVNDTAYTQAKTLDVAWTGVKYALSPYLEATAAFYRYSQRSYAVPYCSDNSSAACSGQLNAFSGSLVYRFARHFDLYGGAMYSRVYKGLAFQYLNTSTIDPMIGGQYVF